MRQTRKNRSQIKKRNKHKTKQKPKKDYSLYNGDKWDNYRLGDVIYGHFIYGHFLQII